MSKFYSQSEHRDRLDPPQYVFVHIPRTPSPTLHNGRTLKEMEGVHNIAGAFMHLEVKRNS